MRAVIVVWRETCVNVYKAWWSCCGALPPLGGQSRFPLSLLCWITKPLALTSCKMSSNKIYLITGTSRGIGLGLVVRSPRTNEADPLKFDANHLRRPTTSSRTM